MFKKLKSLKLRLQSLWFILTSKNFILLHELKEWETPEGTGMSIRVLRRTDYSTKRDLYFMAGAIDVTFPGVGMSIPDAVDELFDENGRMKKK